MALIDHAQVVLDATEEAKEAAGQLVAELTEVTETAQALLDHLESANQEADAIHGYIEERDKDSRLDSAAEIDGYVTEVREAIDGVVTELEALLPDAKTHAETVRTALDPLDKPLGRLTV